MHRSVTDAEWQASGFDATIASHWAWSRFMAHWGRFFMWVRTASHGFSPPMTVSIRTSRMHPSWVKLSLQFGKPPALSEEMNEHQNASWPSTPSHALGLTPRNMLHAFCCSGAKVSQADMSSGAPRLSFSQELQNGRTTGC